MEREGGAWAGNGAKCPMDGRSALMRGPCPTSSSRPAPAKALLWPRSRTAGLARQGSPGPDPEGRASSAFPGAA